MIRASMYDPSLLEPGATRNLIPAEQLFGHDWARKYYIISPPINSLK